LRIAPAHGFRRSRSAKKRLSGYVRRFEGDDQVGQRAGLSEAGAGSGDWEAIARQLLELSAASSEAWLEIVYDGEEVIGDLRARLEAAVAGTAMTILRVRNNRIIDRVMQRMQEDETLDDLNVYDVFQRCLAVHAVPQTQHAVLLRTYRETLAAIDEADTQAE
jgi:DNA repair protein SbcD/Mre11